MKDSLFSSIKWKLLVISFFLVTIPTVVIGIKSYNTFQEEAFVNIEKNLKNISKDWFNMSTIYVLEEDRILKREEFLFQKRLESVTLDAQLMLEMLNEQYGSTPPSGAMQRVLGKISEIQIAKTGNVLIFNSQGDILAMGNKLTKGENFSTSANAQFFSDSLGKILTQKKNETIALTYDWSDADSKESRPRVGVFTYFKPLDLIIGANAYLTDFKSDDLNEKIKDEMKYLMADQKIGEHGYVWAINSKGEYIVSKNMYRNGENIISAKDENGNYVIQDIIEKTKALPSGEAYIRYYSWRDIGEKESSMTLSATVYAPEWDWIIGVSAYHKDFLKGLDTIRMQIIYIVAIMVILGSIIAYIFALFISKPIISLEHVATLAAGGKLDENVDESLIKKPGEIGNLARSFNTMIVNLRTKIDALNTSMSEVSRMNKFMVGRELKMVELKKEIQGLKQVLGVPDASVAEETEEKKEDKESNTPHDAPTV